MSPPLVDQPDFSDQLNFSTWPPKQRQMAEHVRDLLTDLNPSRIEEHRALLPKLPDGPGDAEHFMLPGTYSLLAYGSAELDALYRSSTEDSHSAGFRAGRALLAAAVRDANEARSSIFFAHRYLTREAYERLEVKVVGTCEDDGLSAEAKCLISKLIAHFASDPDRRPELATVLSGLTLLERRDSPSSRLIWELMGSATLQISEELCNQAADLIGQDLNEREYQSFFERHPALLDPLAASVVPQQVLGEMWRTDFVIRRFDDQYVFVEMEKPHDVLFTAYPQPSAALSHALGQVLSWFVWVEDNIAYAASHGFPNIHVPRGLIVIGRGQKLSPEQRRMLRLLNDLVNHRVLIWTYDEVIQNARNVVRNLTSRAMQTP